MVILQLVDFFYKGMREKMTLCYFSEDSPVIRITERSAFCLFVFFPRVH